MSEHEAVTSAVRARLGAFNAAQDRLTHTCVGDSDIRAQYDERVAAFQEATNALEQWATPRNLTKLLAAYDMLRDALAGVLEVDDPVEGIIEMCPWCKNQIHHTDHEIDCAWRHAQRVLEAHK